MNEKPAIGFIGLGLMGSAMVERLQGLGYPMTVVANRSRTAVDAAVGRGATEVKTAREVAAHSDVVMLCMDTSASVEARMLGPDGIIEGVKSGALVIDFGTSLPDSTKRLAPMVAAKGATYMDAPLGRTPSHAKEGKLNIMAAGDPAAFERAKPIFADLGENVFHVGPLGAGHTLKLINNFFAMTTACAMSEAFAMADKAGIARDQLYGVMSAGPLRSGMMDFVKANAIDGNPAMLAFSIANARKDVGYYVRMADDLGVPSVMSVGAKQALSLATAEGWGDRMVPEMVDYLAELFGGKK
ncbi:MAG TPA: NAD(P)-dependent oxidoreductase [Geminicoccus sp.]|jgi:2-hydroxy-3-oxopropionate reductase|uniref:NAD(P)-dependent oxidoreductase n=1 Tax=Geminicoccus sp. TaxID=2024832 RepID=UPI002E364EE7|nr:NAD(P)-dependent oxidoreductase [Geminicoccus sp.]HEX2528709.1 NAD(P)-dependent oxidoreductase [Geminicoccus sp.]